MAKVLGNVKMPVPAESPHSFQDPSFKMDTPFGVGQLADRSLSG
jgi:hypothetical protein